MPPKRLTALVLVGTGIFAAIVVGVLLLILSRVMSHYPGATRSETCSGSGISVSLNIVVLNQCFEAVDDLEIIADWYKENGWFRFGERTIYPGVKWGKFCFEIGKEFVLEQQADGAVLIFQHTLYLTSFSCALPFHSERTRIVQVLSCLVSNAYETRTL